MKTNNAIYKKIGTKNKKSFFNLKKVYKCIFHCQINSNDCINSIDLIDNKVVFGTLMGDVLLCRIDEKKKNENNNNTDIITKRNNNNNKSSTSFPNKIDIIESDVSNIKLENNNVNNKYDCIKLSINGNEDYNGNNDSNRGNIKIFNTKNKKDNKSLKIEVNDEKIVNLNKDIVNYKSNNFTNEEHDEDENSQKYEKKLINKNMGKIQSSNEGNKIKILKINKLKLNTQLFNEKQNQNKTVEINNKNKIEIPQVTKLIVRSKENIPCLGFENDDIINISIGDLEVIRLENMSTFNINDKSSTYNYSKIRNYKTENEHIEFCETCTCMMKNSYFLIIFTKYANYNSVIEIKEIKYEHKNLKHYKIIEGKIKMSNYMVPFDFDGDQFLFLDYVTKEQRKITVFYTESKQEEYNYIISKEYGHISHMKLLPENKIFLCRNNIECEIHLMNEDFTMIEKWSHIGEDVISCCIFINKNFEFYQYENCEKNINNANDNNVLKLIDNNSNNTINKRNIKKLILDSNKEPFQQITNQVNDIKNNTKNENNLMSSVNDNLYNNNNSEKKNKKILFINNIRGLNPSLENSSRREINFSLDNKRIDSYRNLSTAKCNLISNEKIKKGQMNLYINDIFGQNNIRIGKINIKKGEIIENNGENEDAQTIINTKIFFYYLFLIEIKRYYNSKKKIKILANWR